MKTTGNPSRVNNPAQSLPVSEIFGPTIQGEGMHSGRVATFVRFAGCDSKCPWCDTKYAWSTESARGLTSSDIVTEVRGKMHQFQTLVVLTGGNPALYDLGALIRALHKAQCEVHIETQGTLFPDWFSDADFISFSPKPTQGELEQMQISPELDQMVEVLESGVKGQLKFVIDPADAYEYVYARYVARVYSDVPVIFQPKFIEENKNSCRMQGVIALADKMCADDGLSFNVKFMPQMHRILWRDENGV